MKQLGFCLQWGTSPSRLATTVVMVSLSLKLPDHGLEELPSKDVFGSLIRRTAAPHRPIEEGEAKGPRVLTQLVLCFNELQDVTQLPTLC